MAPDGRESPDDLRGERHRYPFGLPCVGGALLCYELPAGILGVRPAAPGFQKVRIEPQVGTLREASGDVITPRGLIHVEWKRDEENALHLHYTLPDGVAYENEEV